MIWEELEAFSRLYRSTLRINSLMYISVSEIVSISSSLTLFIFVRLMISLVWSTIFIMLGYPSSGCKHRKSLQISQNSFAAMLNIALNCSLLSTLVLVSSSGLHFSLNLQRFRANSLQRANSIGLLIPLFEASFRAEAYCHSIKLEALVKYLLSALMMFLLSVV